MHRDSKHLQTPDPLDIADTFDTLEPLGTQSPSPLGVVGSVEIVDTQDTIGIWDWQNVRDTFENLGRHWAPGESESTLDTPRSSETRGTTEIPW